MNTFMRDLASKLDTDFPNRCVKRLKILNNNEKFNNLDFLKIRPDITKKLSQLDNRLEMISYIIIVLTTTYDTELIQYYTSIRDINIHLGDGLEMLKLVPDEVDLILTDPPYIISRDSGMDKLHTDIKKNDGKDLKTEKDWIKYKKNLKKPQIELDNECGIGWSKENYIKYGSIMGKKYAVKTQYGEWDSTFDMETLEKFIVEYYNKLRDGGTVIIWFDLWKITPLKELLVKHKFKQIRFIEWIKTNPQPLNSSLNYLTNTREVAVLAIKGSNPTFNSKYDKGIYEYPIAGGKNKFHPTQKNLELFKELIRKHSREGDIVVDTFLGGGTTALACRDLGRRFYGTEINVEYYEKIIDIITS